MRFLLWLHACLVVYLRRLAAMDSRAQRTLGMLCVSVIVAAFIGPAATLVLLFVTLLILPLLNDGVKREIDAEYAKSKIISNNSRKD